MLSNLNPFQNENFRYRILLLNGIIGYPVWGSVIYFLDPRTKFSLVANVVITGLMVLIVAGSFFVQNPLTFLKKSLIISSLLLVANGFWAAWLSQLSYPVFCGMLVLLGCVLNILPSARSTILIGVGAGVFGVTSFFIGQNWQVPSLLINLALWSTIVPSVFANLTRIRYTQDVQKAREGLTILFENIKEGLVVLRPDGRMQSFNTAAHQILGMTAQQMTELQPLLPPWDCKTETGEDWALESHPVLKALQFKMGSRDSILGLRKVDGGIAWIQLSIKPFRAFPEDSTLSLLVTYSDISEIKESQKTIFDQQSRLEANAKFAALGEMAAGVAHEINNPLAIILGKVFNIRRNLTSGKATETIEQSLEKITLTVDRIKKIVKGLQTFSSGGEQEPFELVQMKDLVEEAASYCQEKLETRRVQVQIDIEPNLMLECRSVQISQCLVNLIHNSCDAIEHEPERWIRIWARSAHNQAVITVTDSGKGIPPEIQKKLMQPFFTTKEVGKGTGLGLSITKGLIQSHLGRIWLDPRSQQTTFVIELPLSHQAVKSAA